MCKSVCLCVLVDLCLFEDLSQCIIFIQLEKSKDDTSYLHQKKSSVASFVFSIHLLHEKLCIALDRYFFLIIAICISHKKDRSNAYILTNMIYDNALKSFFSVAHVRVYTSILFVRRDEHIGYVCLLFFSDFPSALTLKFSINCKIYAIFITFLSEPQRMHAFDIFARKKKLSVGYSSKTESNQPES